MNKDEKFCTTVQIILQAVIGVLLLSIASNMSYITDVSTHYNACPTCSYTYYVDEDGDGVCDNYGTNQGQGQGQGRGNGNRW